jgi:hypothetical protein
MAEDTKDFRYYMLMLRNSAPAPFEEYVNAFELYVGQMMAGIVSCPKEELSNYQGRIQQATGLLHLLKTCDVAVKRPEPAPLQ